MSFWGFGVIFLVCLKYDFKTRTASSSRNILQRCRGSKIYFILAYHWNSGMPTSDLWMMPLLVSILFLESVSNMECLAQRAQSSYGKGFVGGKFNSGYWLCSWLFEAECCVFSNNRSGFSMLYEFSYLFPGVCWRQKSQIEHWSFLLCLMTESPDCFLILVSVFLHVHVYYNSSNVKIESFKFISLTDFWNR